MPFCPKCEVFNLMYQQLKPHSYRCERSAVGKTCLEVTCHRILHSGNIIDISLEILLWSRCFADLTVLLDEVVCSVVELDRRFDVPVSLCFYFEDVDSKFLQSARCHSYPVVIVTYLRTSNPFFFPTLEFCLARKSWFRMHRFQQGSGAAPYS